MPKVTDYKRESPTVGLRTKYKFVLKIKYQDGHQRETEAFSNTVDDALFQAFGSRWGENNLPVEVRIVSVKAMEYA